MTRPTPANRHSPIAIRQSPLVSVCSEIGRGHPSYLDSVLLALARLCPENPPIPCLTVPELCTGTSGLAWKLARTGYRLGAKGGLLTWAYNRLRSADSRPSGLQLSLLGSSLRRKFAGFTGIVLVDHPLLAHILAPVCRVAYLHCEIAAPGLAAVPAAWRTFIPLPVTSRKLQALGIRPEALAVTGLVIEPELAAAAEASYQARLVRLRSDRPLNVGFFLSGARPRPHITRIFACVESLAKSGHKSVLFWGYGMLLAAKLRYQLGRRGIPDDAARVVWSRGRRDETTRTAEVLADLDVMVAAAHERTNWAIGLGLPMFALLPHIGPFAAGNFAFASEQGTCLPLEGIAGAAGLADTMNDLRRSGRLAEMSRNGWGRSAIDGAEVTARALLAAV